ncbi:MAG: type II toxin-antitoxin system RelE/ParE family toxin [Gemmatimonadaceae bacterium]
MYIRLADQKPVLWVGSAQRALRELPTAVRKELGIDLERVQSGRMPRDWKAMSSVGSGVFEIRVRVGGAFRLMYIAKFREGIYVLHVFQKKAKRTAGIDIELARTRMKAVRRLRAKEY